MNQPSVSIIVPVYNVGPYVEDCIRSVMRQTYDGPMECIVVDDCGTDNSMAIVERLVADYTGPIEFKILHHTHNRGLSAARNTGMDAATGDYLFFLDSDDELTVDCIEKLTEPLKMEDFDFVLGFVKYLRVLPSNEIQDTHGPQELNITESIILRSPMIPRRYGKDWANVAWNRLYRTSFLRQNHLTFKEGLLYEDNLWSFQIACLASSLYILNQITYIHKKRKGSIMDMSNSQEVVSNFMVIIQEMGKFVKNTPIKNADIFPFFNYYFCKVLNYYSDSYSEYVSVYKSLRSYIKAPISYIYKANHFRVKKNLHDLHYLLPTLIAPIWQYNIYYRLRHYVHLFLLDHFPKVIISRKWKRKFGYSIDWKHPRDFNEKIQWLLVYSDTSEWTRLADKYKVREYVKEKGLGHLLVPLYGVWENAEEIDFDCLPDKFVLKCNHDSGSTIIVDKNDSSFNRDAICKKLNKCLKYDYGYCGELHYRGIPRKIIAEKYLEMTETEKKLSSSIIDYKVWCFNGKPYYILVGYERTEEDIILNVYDLEWNVYPEYSISEGYCMVGDGRVPKPKSLSEMLEASSTLSKGFPEVRVDFYDVNGFLYFGELTFTSLCGMIKCLTPDFLKMLGDAVELPKRK